MKASILYGALALGLTEACLLPGELGGQVVRQRQLDGPSTRDFPIGKGDRFKNGAVVPRGIGTKNNKLDSILNVGEIRTALKGLANTFDDVKLFNAPFVTYENRTVYGATIGEPRVFIQSGIHARERGGPDNVIYFISDLLHAREAGSGVSYGNHTYSNKDVERALSAGIAIVPMINPDGVAFDQRTDSCWRKNRNMTAIINDDNSTFIDSFEAVGVDLNRNYDFLWDFPEHFSPEANLRAISEDPNSEIFHGMSVFSEAETRNSAWVMNKHPELSWFLDLHSFTGSILYGFGDDDVQTKSPEQSFTNSSYDGKRGIIGEDPPDSVYGEYMTKADLDAQLAVSGKMEKAMSGAGFVKYNAMQSVSLYPTSGGSTDYAMSGFYGKRCGSNRIHGLTIEFGVESGNGFCPFYPNEREYRNNMRQVAAGLMELLLGAAGDLGEAKQYECPGNDNGSKGDDDSEDDGDSKGNDESKDDNKDGDSNNNNNNPGGAGSANLPGLMKVLAGVSIGTLGLMFL